MQEIYSQYLSDKDVAALCADAYFIQKMLEVEIALAQVQAKLEVIPQAAANEIAEKLSQLKVDPEALSDGTLQNGIPTIPLLAIARKALSPQSKDYLHWGATSQDIMDTASILVIREVLQIFESRLLKLIDELRKLESEHKRTLMVARTRTQQAVPMTFAEKVNNWVQPLERHFQRLNELKPRLLILQLGGAGGNLAALGEKGIATSNALADELKLNYIGVWHSQRDQLAEFASWMALLGGSLGKMAQDILLLTQTEIGELIENKQGGGKSSTMPHKNNPVLSEAIVALSRHVMQLAGNHFQAMIHQHERDASAWAIEWMTLPQMMTACGTMLQHATIISQNMQVNKAAMQANLDKLKGLVYAEKAIFMLAKFMTRSEAKRVVGEACQRALEKDLHLAIVLEEIVPHLKIDWKKVLKANKNNS